MINDREITITVGASRKAMTWQPQRLRISELYEKLRIPARGSETLAEYMALPKGQQDELKDVGGYVAGTLDGIRRKADRITGRDVITLDLDNIPGGQTEGIHERMEALGCGFCIYSTRKHSPNKPRLRILMPMDRTCTSDEYEPCARRMAAMIGIEYADPTTFEASRLMYWPSASADGVYVYYTADKPMLSVDGLLNTYEDWRDTSSWPVVPGAPAPARLAAKQGDPLVKKGAVGAFCRVYDIEAAMDAFLPGVYLPTDTPGRYTFAEGTTTGGAVLYDNGKFLYSHHSTDPCSNRLVNSFDMVRLHRFEDLDDDAATDTPVNRLPSYKAMTELAASDEAVARLLLDERMDAAQEAFQPAEEPEEDEDRSWTSQLRLNAQGGVEKSMLNLRTVLENHPQLKGRIRLNLFSGRIDTVGEMPWQRPVTSPVWSDDDAAQLRIFLEPFFGKVAKQDILDAVAATASDQAYHPVREYLQGLQWDGTARLDRLLIDYMGAEDTAYTRAVTRKSFVAAVARVMRPGCKYDTMLVLIGGQGRFKSTALAKMGGEWFSDSLRTFGDKDAMETIQGTWINEIAEMQALNKADIDAVKMFLSKTSDYYRAAYGRYTSDRRRQCVFFGTTNSRECLTDPTGSRRFWCVDIDVIKRRKSVADDLDGERDQLWAEAVAYWRMGEPLYLSPALEKVAREIQEEHRARHPWEGLIQDYIARDFPIDWAGRSLKERRIWLDGGAKYEGEVGPLDRICAAQIWCEVLGRNYGDMRQRDSREINALLERLPDWDNAGRQRAGAPYGQQRCFMRPKSC